MTLRRARGQDRGPRKQRTAWTPMQAHYLKTHYAARTNEELAKTLNKSVQNIIRKARELGIETKEKKQATPILMDRAEEIRTKYRATGNIAKIAKEYHVAYNTISRLLKRLGEC